MRRGFACGNAVGGLILAAVLGGCATGGVTSSIFVDPSKYDLYDCKQLATARFLANNRTVELEGLIAKAQTGFAGDLVSGLAYDSEYGAARAQRDLIDQKLAMNNCPVEQPPAPPVAAPAKKGKRKH